MEEVLKFVIENYQWLIALIFAIATLVVSIFRKKVKVVDSVREFISTHLPSLINIAELLASTGQEKKEMVISTIDKLLSSNFPNVDFNSYIDFINDSIESILSTPQKKGK